MATILDAPAAGVTSNSLTYSISAGSNRRLLVGVTSEGDQTGDITCDYGGETGTLIQQIIVGTGSLEMTVALFEYTESQIASAGTTTVSVGNANTYIIHAASYQDCEQTTPLTNFDTDSSTSSTPNPLAALDITTTDTNSIVVAVSGCGNGTTATWASPLTERTDSGSAESASGSLADDEVATTQTVACECTWASQNRAAAVAVEIKDITGGGGGGGVPLSVFLNSNQVIQ